MVFKNDKNLKYQKAGEVLFCLTEEANIEVNTQLCDECFEFLNSLKTNSFYKLMLKVNTLVYVHFNVNNWKLSRCSCGWWNKNFICRHVIDIVVKKMDEYPV